MNIHVISGHVKINYITTSYRSTVSKFRERFIDGCFVFLVVIILTYFLKTIHVKKFPVMSLTEYLWWNRFYPRRNKLDNAFCKHLIFGIWIESCVFMSKQINCFQVKKKITLMFLSSNDTGVFWIYFICVWTCVHINDFQICLFIFLFFLLP